MAPPTHEELANRERMIRRAVARLDPQGLTPAALREGKSFPLTRSIHDMPLRRLPIFHLPFQFLPCPDHIITNWLLMLQ